MARHFITGSTQAAAAAACYVQSVPVTMAVWFRTATNVNGTLVALTDTGNSLITMRVEQRLTGALRATYHDGTTASTATTTALSTLNGWNHACGVFETTASRWIYLNGGNGVQSTTSVTGSMASLNQTVVGRGVGLSYATADIAYAAYWRCALTPLQVWQLSRGWSPIAIRPWDLFGYDPITGYESPELNQGIAVGTVYNLTLENAPTPITSPNLIIPTYYRSRHKPAAATGRANRLTYMGVS